MGGRNGAFERQLRLIEIRLLRRSRFLRRWGRLTFGASHGVLLASIALHALLLRSRCRAFHDPGRVRRDIVAQECLRQERVQVELRRWKTEHARQFVAKLVYLLRVPGVLGNQLLELLRRVLDAELRVVAHDEAGEDREFVENLERILDFLFTFETASGQEFPERVEHGGAGFVAVARGPEFLQEKRPEILERRGLLETGQETAKPLFVALGVLEDLGGEAILVREQSFDDLFRAARVFLDRLELTAQNLARLALIYTG
ncbi:MAG: hypothetical protein BWY66_02900 [bacterium ADurb.Bin374]|nr:MAG: hypothetical protein BWY66_02900 [bacterium ADurb.Bin374]